MHITSDFNKYLLFTDENRKEFVSSIVHRAIGVVYRPVYGHLGNYVRSITSNRYNGFIFIDLTTALHPLVLEKGE